MSKIMDRFLLDMTKSRESKEMFLQIIGFEKDEVEEVIDSYANKSMSLMDQFIEALEDETLNIPQINTN